jgi:hypothetical protein
MTDSIRERGSVMGTRHGVREIEARARALRALSEAEVPVLVAGAYAFFEYTGTYRETKDLDLALCEKDLPAAFRVLDRAGFRTELLDPVWLGKAYSGESYVDLIFSSGNGVARVDDLWFRYASPAMVMGQPCTIVPVEEMIWSKAFVNERDRYDGADVNHLIYACGERLDWERLLLRFDRHWEVLFAHVILYRFAYPSARSRVPAWVVNELCRRTQHDIDDIEGRVCRGHLISGVQYRVDYESHGFDYDHVEPPDEVVLEAPLSCARPAARASGLRRARRR